MGGPTTTVAGTFSTPSEDGEAGTNCRNPDLLLDWLVEASETSSPLVLDPLRIRGFLASLRVSGAGHCSKDSVALLFLGPLNLENSRGMVANRLSKQNNSK